MRVYSWRPIKEPPSDASTVIPPEMPSLYDAWRALLEKHRGSESSVLTQFNERLVRRLSIETGILEKLYDVDRGTTETLIQHGFAEDLVSHGSTNIQPARLIEILRDQHAAIERVFDCVARKIPLTKGVIHELHSIITRHQDTIPAKDSMGGLVDVPLRKGAYKILPNNPQREDGTMHEYCPPEHVDSEMEQLLCWLDEYRLVDPIALATWFHHRFTQIHPYQDGNGRLARTLTTLVLARAELLPIVIDRKQRAEYIAALEKADDGSLFDLVRLFSALERTAILKALSVDSRVDSSGQRALSEAVLLGLQARFNRRVAREHEELRRANEVALALRSIAAGSIKEKLSRAADAFASLGSPRIDVREGGSDTGTAYWYKAQVMRAAREAENFVNFQENHYFLSGFIAVQQERLKFVVSFHHVGRDLSGIMESVAFAELNVSSGGRQEREFVGAGEFVMCSLEPFIFTHRTRTDDSRGAFLMWLDEALALAFREFGDRL